MPLWSSQQVRKLALDKWLAAIAKLANSQRDVCSLESVIRNWTRWFLWQCLPGERQLPCRLSQRQSRQLGKELSWATPNRSTPWSVPVGSLRVLHRHILQASSAFEHQTPANFSGKFKAPPGPSHTPHNFWYSWAVASAKQAWGERWSPGLLQGGAEVLDLHLSKSENNYFGKSFNGLSYYCFSAKGSGASFSSDTGFHSTI